MSLGESQYAGRLRPKKKGMANSGGFPELERDHAEYIFDALSGGDVIVEEVKEPEPAGLEEEEEEPKPEIEPELELEKALELAEQEVIDDPVRMYLREIGKVSLLKAEQEKFLASKMELDRHISHIEDAWFATHGTTASAVDVILTALERIGESSPVVDALAQELGLAQAASLQERVSDPSFRAAIDGEIDQQLVRAIAERTWETLTQVEQGLVTLSLDTHLLPSVVFELVGDKTPSEISVLISEPRFIGSLKYRERVRGISGRHRSRGSTSGKAPCRGQLAAGCQCGQEVYREGNVSPRSDSRGQHRTDQGSGEVRLSQGLQVQHLCYLVDQAGDYQSYSRPGADYPYPSSYGGDHQ